MNDEEYNKIVEGLWQKAAEIFDRPKQSSYVNGFFFKSAGGKLVPDYHGLGDYFRDEKNLIAFEHSAWIYNGKYYERIGRQGLCNLVLRLTNEQASVTQIKNFVDMALVKCHKQYVDENNDGYLNLANGILRLKDRKLLDHSPGFFFKYCLDTSFNKNADCPRWLSFLNDTFGGDSELINLAQEIFGYTLIGGDPFLHKAFVLYGDGRNGKSTFLSALTDLIGKQNTSNVPINMLDKPFSVVNLDGKLANLTGEIPNGLLGQSDAFKSAVAGEPLIAAQKGKPEYNLYVKARFFFAANKLPKFGDIAPGLYERMVILPFTRYIPPEKRDPGIFEKLRRETPGILNWALDGLDRVLKRKRLNEPDACREMKEVYREETDSVYAWANEYLEESRAPGAYVIVSNLYDAYCKNTREDGKFPVNKNEFCQRLSKWVGDQGPSSNIEKTRRGRQKIRGFKQCICKSKYYRTPDQSEFF